MTEPRDALKQATEEGGYAFCTDPPEHLLLSPAARRMCPLADDLPSCEALKKSCEVQPASDYKWLEDLTKALGPVAQVVAYALAVAGIVLALTVIARAIARRGTKQKADAAGPNVATAMAKLPDIEEQLRDPEEALRIADALAAEGALDRAMSVYLAASLGALDRQGAIRLAKHRTNGEYVRACVDDEARPGLREIVREVDRVEFGKVPPTKEAVSRVAGRATALVRSAIARAARVAAVAGTVAIVASFTLGCNALSDKKNPAGSSLAKDVLGRVGFQVKPLETPIPEMPLPKGLAEEEEGFIVNLTRRTPMLIVDLAEEDLEDDARAHLMRWVEAGGLLVTFDPTVSLRKDLSIGLHAGDAESSRDLFVKVEDEDGRRTTAKGRLASASAIDTWEGAKAIAWVGKEGDADNVYAAWKPQGRGAVLVVANADLLTNVGISVPDNAAALVAILHTRDDLAGRTSEGLIEVRIAGQGDGITPPNNPFTAILRAGLTKAMAHALVAALLLFLAYGIRNARPKPAEAKARRAFAEHVEATGTFYLRANAWPHALAAYGRFAEMRVREKAGKSDPVAFLAARTGAPEGEIADVYQRATTAEDDAPIRGDERRTIEALRALLARL